MRRRCRGRSRAPSASRRTSTRGTAGPAGTTSARSRSAAGAAPPARSRPRTPRSRACAAGAAARCSPAEHRDDLARGAYARHAREDPPHELLVIVELVRRAGIARDDEVVIEVVRREGGRRDADVGRAADEDERVDPSNAQRLVEVRVRERAPTELRHDEVLGPRGQLVDDLPAPLAGDDRRTPVRLRERPEAGVGVRPDVPLYPPVPAGGAPPPWDLRPFPT